MSAYLSLIRRRRGGRLFEAGRLLTFAAFRMGAYSRWALIRGWALIRINTVNVSLEQGSPTLFVSRIPQGICRLHFFARKEKLIIL